MTTTDIDQTQLHFIIGSGRSGTTLLSQALNAHPNMVASPEGKFLLHYLQPFAGRELSAPDIAAFADHTLRIREHDLTDFRLWLLPQQQFIDRLQSLAPLRFEQLCKAVHLQSFIAREKNSPIRVVVDKNPSYTYFTPQLLEVFPQAKFIALVRDYRHNIASRLKHRLDANAWQAAHRWRICNTILHQALQQHPSRVLLLRYEDLTAQPQASLERVCAFLGVPFDEQMLHPDRLFSAYFPQLLQFLDLPQGSTHLQEMHQNIAQPISTTYQDKGWQHKLDAQQLHIAEAVCGSLGKQFGYATTNNNHHAPDSTLAFGLKKTWYAWRMKFFLIYFMKTYFRVPIALRRLKTQLSRAPRIKDYVEP